MGNSVNSNQQLDKGEGFRIIKVEENSPFRGKVEEFFDFIIEIIPPKAQKAPGEILDKLSNQSEVKPKKSPIQIFTQNIGKVIEVKVVSTKFRNIRTIQVDLVQNKQEQQVQKVDKIGLNIRKERYDEVFDTYFPVADIQSNSPIKKSGIREGQFLIGCVEYPYKTIDGFMQGLYQRYFDKQITDKKINLAVYDLGTDSLILKEVSLKRGWGGKGLLGCEFMQGLLNKFPHNLEDQRKQIRQKQNKQRQIQMLRNELGNCDGASKLLIDSLQSKKKRGIHFKNIRNLLNVVPPNLEELNVPQEEPRREEQINQVNSHQIINPEQTQKILELEKRVAFLESTLLSVRDYMNKMEQEIEEDKEVNGKQNKVEK